ncbi:MAG: hypothetical protein AAF654_05140 [Myxococcota bacterium]
MPEPVSLAQHRNQPLVQELNGIADAAAKGLEGKTIEAKQGAALSLQSRLVTVLEKAEKSRVTLNRAEPGARVDAKLHDAYARATAAFEQLLAGASHFDETAAPTETQDLMGLEFDTMKVRGKITGADLSNGNVARFVWGHQLEEFFWLVNDATAMGVHAVSTRDTERLSSMISATRDAVAELTRGVFDLGANCPAPMPVSPAAGTANTAEVVTLEVAR